MFERIKPEDLAGKGVIGLPDTPKLTTDEMQKKFEETAREVIVPKFNARAEQLEAPAAAAQIGATNAVGAKSTVQLEIERLRSGLKNAENNVEIANENAEDAVEAADAATKTATEAAAAAVEAKRIAENARDNANLANTKAEGANDRAGRAENYAAYAVETSQDAVKLVETGITGHNTNTNAHADLRMELKALADRINAALDSDDTTLDEMSEIVAYIKSNKSLIDAITISKVNVSDIVNNLVTNVENKPLSAAQGVALKALIDEVEETAKGLDITEFQELSDEQRTAARTNIAAVSYEADQGLNNFARYNARTNIKAVSYEAAPQTPLTEEEKEQARKNIGAAAEGETGAKNAVTYTEQTLTESEKGQARKNIGAASPADLTAATEKAVTYDSTQTLTTMQQAAARENIGAAPTSHTDNSGRYGKADFSLFGHVRLMDGANKSQNTDGGFAATPYALWRETSNRVSVEAQELTEEQKAQARANIGAALTNHASLDKDLYGAGGGSKYGHVKLSSSISSDADENGGTAATPHAVKTVYDWAFGQNKENVKITAQTLTDAQKAQVRANIGAAAVGEGGGWVQPDWDSADGVDGHIKNRTHWKDWEYVEVVPIKDITVNSSTVPNTTDTTTGAYAGIVEGSKVSVYWNGTWYDRTAFVSGNAVYIGNHRILSSTGANTGEPFLLRKVSADRMTIYPEAPLAGAQVVFDYGLKLAEPVYHKLPKEYLPDDIGGGATPDWNAAEGEPGHILNRPFYTEGGAVILEEMEVSNVTYDGIVASFTKHLGIEVGQTYTVVCGGVAYECVGQDFSAALDVPAVALGDLSMLGLSGNGEPFMLYDTAQEIDQGVYGGVMTEEPTTIAIYRETVHKLPGKFLPDGVPYVEQGEPVVLLPATEAQKMDDADVDSFVIPVVVNGVEAEKSCIINYNGAEYKCIAQDFSAMGAGSVVFGNLGALEMGENTGEPFAITVMPSEGVTMIIPFDGASSITISISLLPEKLNKIDPRLLPDGVISDVLIVKSVDDMETATHTSLEIQAACLLGGKACFFAFADKTLPLCGVNGSTGQARFSLVYTVDDGNLWQTYVMIEADGTISDYASAASVTT